MANPLQPEEVSRPLRLDLEEKAKAIKDKLLTKSREGELDILTFLELSSERYHLPLVVAQLALLSPGDTDFIIIQAYIRRVTSFHNQLHSYFLSSTMQHCVEQALRNVIDKEAFQRFKTDWKQFRHTYMMDIRLHDASLADSFVLLECVGRMLLIHHEQQSADNVRKNLKLIDHLIVKHDLNDALKRLGSVVTLMHLLGNKFDNQSLKNRLKNEGCHFHPTESMVTEESHQVAKSRAQTEKQASPKISVMRVSPIVSNLKPLTKSPPNFSGKSEFKGIELFPSFTSDKRSGLEATVQSRFQLIKPNNETLGAFANTEEVQAPTWPQTANIDTSFLSDKSESSISFMDQEEKRLRSSARKDSRRMSAASKSNKCGSRPRTVENKGSREKFRHFIESDIREMTRERINAKLKPILGEQKSKAASCNIEARLFGMHYNDENGYDVKYSKIISFLEMMSLCPSLVSPLLDNQFDLDFILAKADSLQPMPSHSIRTSQDKTTQTFLISNAPRPETFSRVASLGSLDKSSTTDANTPAEFENRLMGQLRADETSYLQRLVHQTRQENDFLRRTIFELRLNIGANSEDKTCFL
jgi:hypothetical protein